MSAYDITIPMDVQQLSKIGRLKFASQNLRASEFMSWSGIERGTGGLLIE